MEKLGLPEVFSLDVRRKIEDITLSPKLQRRSKDLRLICGEGGEIIVESRKTDLWDRLGRRTDCGVG